MSRYNNRFFYSKKLKREILFVVFRYKQFFIHAPEGAWENQTKLQNVL